MTDKLIEDYYEKNKEWLRELSVSGDPIVKAIALTILKRGAPHELD